MKSDRRYWVRHVDGNPRNNALGNIVIERGTVRFQPTVYCRREFRPSRMLLWDRYGR